MLTETDSIVSYNPYCRKKETILLKPNLILLYVQDPAESSAFYSRLLGRQPSALFPTYAAFEFDGGVSLGLWSTSAENFHTSGKATAPNSRSWWRTMPPLSGFTTLGAEWV